MSRASELRLLERTGALFAQLFFIAAGVYLGNRADAWKEERSHREAARASLASQTLTYLDPRLAFEIGDVYLAQQRYEEYQLTTQRAAFNPASLRPDGLGSLGLLFAVYYNDAAASNDPELVRQYAALLPRLDSALGATRR